MGDSYHPSSRYRDYRDDYQSYRPPPPPSAPMYHFGGESYRPERNVPDSYRPPEHQRGYHNDNRNGDFSFRSNVQGPRFSPEPPSHSDRAQDRPRKFKGRPDQKGVRGRKGPNRFNFSANNRTLLRTKRESTPEQLLGMTEGSARFKDVGDLSESEADMELDSDMEHTEDGLDGEGPSKSKKARVSHERADGDSVPKWSNPDPYTVLPPPDETQTKKKDVVKLIRKAKVAAAKAEASSNAMTENADFISFNFDDEAPEQSSSASSDDNDSSVEVAPGEQKRFSHLDHLHPDRTATAPGTTVTAMTASSLGPPSGNGVTSTVTSQTVSISSVSAGKNQFTQLNSAVNLDVWPPPDVQTAINTKKRTQVVVEEFAPLPQVSKKRKRQGPLTGDITEEWRSRSRQPTPWCTIDHSKTEQMGFWLHKEICDFYDFVRPHHFENTIRQDLITRISEVLRRKYPNGQLYCFGSFAAGLYLPTADMDLVFVSDGFRRRGVKEFAPSASWMHKFAHALEVGNISQKGSSEVVAKARVPIIKFVDRFTGIKVDISFENMTGVIANETFQQWKAQYPAMPVLVTLIKQFLLMRGLNEVFTGGIGGFTVTCLVVSLLQHLPSVQSGNMVPEQNLGQLLIDFLDLYGNKFNIATTAISMRPPGYFFKDAHAHPYRLSIIDPNNASNDISNGSHKVDLVLEAFQEAHTSLRKHMASLHSAKPSLRQNKSLLGVILGGDYSSFEWQRSRLRQMYERRQVPPDEMLLGAYRTVFVY